MPIFMLVYINNYVAGTWIIVDQVLVIKNVRCLHRMNYHHARDEINDGNYSLLLSFQYLLHGMIRQHENQMCFRELYSYVRTDKVI